MCSKLMLLYSKLCSKLELRVYVNSCYYSKLCSKLGAAPRAHDATTRARSASISRRASWKTVVVNITQRALYRAPTHTGPCELCTISRCHAKAGMQAHACNGLVPILRSCVSDPQVIGRVCPMRTMRALQRNIAADYGTPA